MPLFVCDGCVCIENTALGDYWTQPVGNRKCSACATGSWHGLFPKLMDDGSRDVVYRPGIRKVEEEEEK